MHFEYWTPSPAVTWHCLCSEPAWRKDGNKTFGCLEESQTFLQIFCLLYSPIFTLHLSKHLTTAKRTHPLAELLVSPNNPRITTAGRRWLLPAKHSYSFVVNLKQIYIKHLNTSWKKQDFNLLIIPLHTAFPMHTVALSANKLPICL